MLSALVTTVQIVTKHVASKQHPIEHLNEQVESRYVAKAF